MRNKKGFTLMEMLIVIGIISVLMGITIGTLGGFSKKAKRAKDQEIVSNAATALNIILQNKREWPVELLNAQTKDTTGSLVLDENACLAFIKNNLLDIASKNENGKKRVDPQGPDRFGILDSAAADVVKRGSTSVQLSTIVPGYKTEKKTVQDHRIRFAIDNDYDGFTEVQIAGETYKVRANACCWSAGPDGEIQSFHQAGRSDDTYSWNKNQIKR